MVFRVLTSTLLWRGGGVIILLLLISGHHLLVEIFILRSQHVELDVGLHRERGRNLLILMLPFIVATSQLLVLQQQLLELCSFLLDDRSGPSLHCRFRIVAVISLWCSGARPYTCMGEYCGL